TAIATRFAWGRVPAIRGPGPGLSGVELSDARQPEACQVDTTTESRDHGHAQWSRRSVVVSRTGVLDARTGTVVSALHRCLAGWAQAVSCRGRRCCPSGCRP